MYASNNYDTMQDKSEFFCDNTDDKENMKVN